MQAPQRTHFFRNSFSATRARRAKNGWVLAFLATAICGRAAATRPQPAAARTRRRPTSRAGLRPELGQPPAHVDGRYRAIDQAVEAEHAFRLQIILEGAAVVRAVVGAGVAAGVQFSLSGRLQEGIFRQQAVQGAQRAEGVAEKAAPVQVQQQQAEKDHADPGGLQEGSLLDREQEAPAEVVYRLGDPAPQALALRPGLQGMLQEEIRSRQDHGGRAARQQRNRVKPAQQLAGEKRSDQQDDQQHIFQPQRALRHPLLPPAPRAQPGEELVQGAERADPTAEKTPEDQRQQQRDQGKQKGAKKRRRENIDP